MRRVWAVLALLALAASLVLTTSVPASAAPPSEADQDGDKIYDDLEDKMEVRPDNALLDVIVLFKQGKSAAETAEAESEVGDFDSGYLYKTIPAVAAEMTVAQIEELSTQPDIAHIQRDAPMQVMLDTARQASGVDAARLDFGVVGDDVSGNNESSSTCPELTSYCKDDVVVAVIDTGIRATHVDLDGGKVLGFANCYTSTSCPEVAAFDDNGHGTHVSSIIAGTGEGSSSRSLAGVAPGAALVGVKVLGSSGSGSTSGVDAGVEWVINNRARFGIEILNMSLGISGSYDGTDTTSRVVNRAAAAGVTPFVSAGNSGPKRYTIGSPAAAKFAVTVGAMSDPQDTDGSRLPGFGLVDFSSRGPTADGRTKPDIASYGVDIMAASSSSNTGYTVKSGTSMSSPFAAGVGALMVDANPALGSFGTACSGTGECSDGVDDSTMVTTLKDRMMATAIDWGPAGTDNDYGAGRLDVHAAVRDALSGSAGAPPLVPAHSFTSDSLPGTGAQDVHNIAVTSTNAPIAITLVMPNWASSSNPDFDMELKNPSGAVVATATGASRQDTIGYRPTSTGLWTLRVYSYAGSGAYWFDLSYPGGPAAPAAPSGLVATAIASGQIDLAWTHISPPDEDGFTVERASGGGSWSPIATLPANSTTYSDTSVQPATAYDYRVRAYNSVGESGNSNTASATTPAPPAPPNAPSGLTPSVVSTSQIDLSWTDNSDNETGFNIQRATSLSGPWGDPIATVAAGVTGFSDTGLSASTTYYYRVHAYNAVGPSGYSEASATTLAPEPPPAPPNAPTNLIATAASDTQINLSWADNSSNENGFKVERAPADLSVWEPIATLPAGANTYSDTGRTPSTTYHYRVYAYSAAGNSGYSDPASATTLASPPPPPPPTPPAAPSALGATASSPSQINLVWTDNSSNENGFRIERSPNGTSGWTEIGTTGQDIASFSDTGLNASTTYYYQVRAYNADGNSGYSNAASATTPAPPTPPAAPSSLTATAPSSTQINLAWTDNSNNETGFKVERATSSSGPWTEIGTTTAPNYSDSGLAARTYYYYRVRAYNSAGDSAFSSTAYARTLSDTTPPGTPTNLDAFATPGATRSITLTWDGVTDTGGSGLSGYRIYRSTSATGSFSSITTVYDTTCNPCSYVNTGRTSGRTYWYYVRAIDRAGNRSPNSNTDFATAT